MRYTDATRLLYELAPRGVMLGLSRVEQALALRGEPQRCVPAVVIAGTNGKGSVAAMLASVLRAEGYRTGLYTSPHLHRMTERFWVNGKPISQRDFARRVDELAPFLSGGTTPPLTFFEACTLLAFEIFRDARCEIAVLEVGLGGRLDATNVAIPLVSVISSIALDHQDRLGGTIARIASEKAGIIKPGVPVVTAARHPSALRVIAAQARQHGAQLWRYGREIRVATRNGNSDISVQGRVYKGLRLPLAGAHQTANLACVVGALDQLSSRGFPVSQRALKAGLRRTRWPARLELVAGTPSVLLDAAHNPEACESLARHLAGLSDFTGRRILIFGTMRDKDHAAMLKILKPQVLQVVFATPYTPRALPASELQAAYGGVAIDEPVRALARAKKLAGKRGLVIVAGSIFLVAPLRATLLGLGMDKPIAM